MVLTLELFVPSKCVLSPGSFQPTRRTGTPVKYAPLVQNPNPRHFHEVGIQHSFLPVAALRDALAAPDLY